MTTADPLTRALSGAGPALGLWATLPSALTAELAAHAGYDYVCVDEQHGAVGPAEVAAMLQAVRAGGATALVRVAANQPWLVTRALDLGAHGVVVPMVDDAQQAAAAVAACRYPPEGSRSFGPVRAQLVLGSAAPRDLAAGARCFAMVETRSGLEQVEAIAATPGLDGIYVGPFDLSLALGEAVPGATLESPVLLEALRRVREACAANGIVAGVHCLGGADGARFAAEGFRLVTVGVDSLVLGAGLAAELAVARAGGRDAAAGEHDHP